MADLCQDVHWGATGSASTESGSDVKLRTGTASGTLLLCMMVSLVGCSRGPSNVAPVTGQILFNGLPARAAISSQAVNEKGEIQGRPSTADTNADGTFALLYAENQPGALVGTHRVSISIYPLERAVGEFDFQTRFKPVKVVKFTRQVAADGNNRWDFPLTY